MTVLEVYARGLGFLLAGGATIFTLALALALPLGTLAANGPRVCDTGLRFVCDCASALPTVFVAAVAWAIAGRATGYVLALGLLRGLEQAWLLRCELVRLTAADPDAAFRSFGQTPLLAFVRFRLASTAALLFVHGTFSMAWLGAIDGALTQTGLWPQARPDGWAAALAAPRTHPALAAVALASLALTTALLQALSYKLAPPEARLDPTQSERHKTV